MKFNKLMLALLAIGVGSLLYIPESKSGILSNIGRSVGQTAENIGETAEEVVETPLAMKRRSRWDELKEQRVQRFGEDGAGTQDEEFEEIELAD